MTAPAAPAQPVDPVRPPRVDAHQHLWRLARGDYRWLRADVPALAPIHRDFEPDDLLPLLQAHGVSQTVLVQAADSEAETEYMLQLATLHGWIGGVVGWVDLSRRESVPALRRWAGHPKFKGVRPMLQDLPEADWIARLPHPEVMACIADLGLRVDALVQPWHLSHLLRFLDRHPDLPVVIDHAAKPQLASRDEAGGWHADWAQPWRAGMTELASRPGLHCKVSGLLTEADGAARAGGAAGRQALQPVWHLLRSTFGPQRLIWGSDWPVLNLAADYAAWIALSDELMQDLSPEEQRAIRHDNAVAFYGLTL
ncbi:amidohydrolase family protein [Leptothrix discophora]|uniref:Amidohydrolase family protein n=1 Tax=Leptothrix discophora TaxID=89 RepID=A0ABT9G1Y1_LEPDI|nr:amidohydrolase family protein [Leptothrix discophora]MDP4300493.1 amidohydrolase family protein [Leptothrix discophora]